MIQLIFKTIFHSYCSFVFEFDFDVDFGLGFFLMNAQSTSSVA